ncbi:Competence protein F [Rhodobacteraceae bacterium HTCC2150]|nr:Competence protein F [Rhodobacteraceae bacterium HTCC2150]
MQTALRIIYPAQCLTCGDIVDSEFGFCGACWRETPFITGLICDLCGTSLPGDASEQNQELHCDECMRIARPWEKGRSAMIYKDNARRFVLGLKHGDRLDFARPAANWIAAKMQGLVPANTIVAPVPMHWLRLLRRRYNQAALISGEVSKVLGLTHRPDLLIRPRATKVHQKMTADERFANLVGAIDVHPKAQDFIKGRSVLIIDDVMTSGAILAASTEAAKQAGADDVFVATLARVAKDA